MSGELTVKGIIIGAVPQGEYGRRIRLISDRLGKISIFASGAAKQGSKIMGAVRPMTCAAFRIAKGRAAYSLHGADVIDSFEELSRDFELSVYAAYVLELGDYFSEEGMPEEEARKLLNLMYVTLDALRSRKADCGLIMSIYRLRLLVLQGEYTEMPLRAKNDITVSAWKRCIASPLSALYDMTLMPKGDMTEFIKCSDELFDGQVKHSFRSLRVLRDSV